jgi:hypothetical protein
MGDPARAAFTFGAANFWAANSASAGRERESEKKLYCTWEAVSDRSREREAESVVAFRFTPPLRKLKQQLDRDKEKKGEEARS